jgi:hypothetical protein
VTSVKQAARRAESSRAAEWGARAGLVARGLLWLVVGFLALQVALGGHERADRGGALQALKDQPFGTLLLVVLAGAFTAHAAFRLLEGTVGRRDEDDDRKRLLKRAWSLCRVVIYGALAVGTVRFLLSDASSGGDASGPTARLLGVPAGRTLLGIVGAGVVLGGLVQGVRGVRQDFTDKLDMPSGRMRTAVERVGAAGLVGRGLVYVLVGSFLVEAAVTTDPHKAKGLDAALKTLANRPYGTLFLLVAVLGLLSFAAWSFLEARYRDL